MYAAMKWLAESRDAFEAGITQSAEIPANRGVIYIGLLSPFTGLK